MASCAAPKRRAKPARGRRSTAPMVRTPARAEARQRLVGPAQRAQRQRRQLPDELRERSDHQRPAGTGGRQRRERRGRKCEHRAGAEPPAFVRERDAAGPPRLRNSCRLPCTSSSRPSGGSRLTRGVKRWPGAPAAQSFPQRRARGRCTAAHSSRAAPRGRCRSARGAPRRNARAAGTRRLPAAGARMPGRRRLRRRARVWTLAS